MRKVMTAALVAALVLAMGVPTVALAKPVARIVVKAKGKPTFVSHPYTKRDTVKAGAAFSTWGYVNTWRAVPLSTDSTLTIQVQKWKSGRSWETSTALETTAKLATSGKFKKKMNYTAALNIGVAGRYRLVAVLTWKDAQGVQRTKWSSWKYIRIR